MKWAVEDITVNLRRRGVSLIFPATRRADLKPVPEELLANMATGWPVSSTWRDITKAVYNTLGELGSKLSDKFRVVPAQVLGKWHEECERVAESLGLEGTVVQNAMLLQYPLMHPGINPELRVAQSPCMFLITRQQRAQASSANVRLPAGMTAVGDRDYTEVVPGVGVVPRMCGSTGKNRRKGKETDHESCKPSYVWVRLAKTGEKPVEMMAHRLMAWVFLGPSGDRSRDVVMHVCDEPACVNPWHMYWGTRGENRAGHNPDGEKGPNKYSHLTMPRPASRIIMLE